METAYLITINETGEDEIIAKLKLTKDLSIPGELVCFTMIINGGKEIPAIYCEDKQADKKIRKIMHVKADTLPKLRSYAYIEEIYNFALLEKVIGEC